MAESKTINVFVFNAGTERVRMRTFLDNYIKGRDEFVELVLVKGEPAIDFKRDGMYRLTGETWCDTRKETPIARIRKIEKVDYVRGFKNNTSKQANVDKDEE